MNANDHRIEWCLNWGEDTYADRAPRMLEYFGELCRAQAENPDEPRI